MTQAVPTAAARAGTAPDTDAVLASEALSLVYKTRRGSIEALRDVDLQIGVGEFVTLLGPSGCGKSTLLKIAAGLLTPTSGRMVIAGETVTEPRPDIGVAFQKPTLLPWKTVLANVVLPAETLGQDMQAARVRGRELLELMDLAAFADNYPHELSGGMQQRVGLARMLLRDPRLLLMDEPFSALDALTRETLMLELQRVWMRDTKSVMFITHSIPEAVFLSDRVLVMSPRPGRIVEDFRIDLPRPRTLDSMSTPAFADASRHLRQHFIS